MLKKLEKFDSGTDSGWKKGSCPEKVFGERHLKAAWQTAEKASFEEESASFLATVPW